MWLFACAWRAFSLHPGGFLMKSRAVQTCYVLATPLVFPHDFPMISQQFPNGFPPSCTGRIQDGVPRTWTQSCSSVRMSEAWPEMAPMFTFITFDNHRES